MIAARTVLVPGLVLLLAACSTTSSRIEENQSVYNSYPPEVQQKIKAGDIAVGFNGEQVRMALGKPDRVYTRQTETGASEVWAYRDSSPALSFGLGGFGIGGNSGVGGGVGVGTGGSDEEKVRVVFADGRVISVERTVK